MALFVCRGWDVGFGGRSKAREFQRVGSFAPVGGDGLVVSFLQCVFFLCQELPLEKRPSIYFVIDLLCGFLTYSLTSVSQMLLSRNWT